MVALAKLADLEMPVGAGRWAVLALLLWPPPVFLFAGLQRGALPRLRAARLARRTSSAAGRWPGPGRRRLLRTDDRPVPRHRAGRGVPRQQATPTAGGVAAPPVRADRRSTPPTSTPVRVTGWPGTPPRRPAGGVEDMGGLGRLPPTTWERGHGRAPVRPVVPPEVAGAIVGAGYCSSGCWSTRFAGAEFVYVGSPGGRADHCCDLLHVDALGGALLWWPLWVLIGRTGARHRWVIILYATVIGPLTVPMVVSFMNSSWTG